MKITTTPLMLAVGMAALSGCISHQETTYRNVERTKVAFENDKAARLFYETLNNSPSSGDRSESKTEVKIPFIFNHEARVLPGPNAAFNDAVARCDTNRDGQITEQEATIFAGHSHQP